jgi:hypothetical protein
VVGAGVSAAGQYSYLKNSTKSSLVSLLNSSNPYKEQFAKQLSSELATAGIGLSLGLSAISIAVLASQLKKDKNLTDRKYKNKLGQLNQAATVAGFVGGAGAGIGLSELLTKRNLTGKPSGTLALLGGGLVGGIATGRAFKSRFGYNKNKGY